MDFDTWIARLGLPLATYLISLVSALVPLVNAEAYLVFAALAFPRESLAAVVLFATAGQMTGKLLLYLVGSGVLRLPFRSHERGLEKARASLESHRGRSGGVIFLSALVGLPPFYAVSLAAGVLRTRLLPFLVLGSLGRGLRFASCVLFPQLVRRAF